MIKKGDDPLDRQNPCNTKATNRSICTQQIAVSHG